MSHSIPDIIPELIDMIPALEEAERDEDTHTVFRALLSGVRTAIERFPDGFNARKVQQFYEIRIEDEEVKDLGSEETPEPEAKPKGETKAEGKKEVDSGSDKTSRSVPSKSKSSG